MAKPPITIIMVHGAWADGSSWNKVIQLLQDKGFALLAVQLPLTSVADDLAATNRIMLDVPGDVVLVGHSWGGMAITQAGIDPKVKALVYVSAFAPDIGETGSSLIGAHPAPPALSSILTDGAGFVYQTASGMVENVAPDLPKNDSLALAVTQGRLAGAAFGQTVIDAAWKTKPAWFVITTDDRVVSVELQTYEADRMDARKTFIAASHMSLLSQPSKVVAVIEEAAAFISSGEH
jgi:pimeloyl-ACP methyl ester carboxylesterase